MDALYVRGIPLNTRKLKLVFLHILILYTSQTLFAENILLKNGRNVKAKVIEQSVQGITIRKEDGSTETIQKSQILKVIYHEASAEELEKIRRVEQQKIDEQHKLEEQRKLADEQRLEEQRKLEEQKKDEELKKTALTEKKKILPQVPKDSGKHFSYLWRSALVPGWGQYNKNQKIKSSFFFFGTIIAAATLFTYDSKYHSAQSNLKSQESIFLFSTGGVPDLILYNQIQNSRQELDSNGKIAQNASIALLTIYLFNLADAYFWKPKETQTSHYDSTSKKGPELSVNRTILEGRKDDQISLQYHWRF
jgi:hypothetical protein